MFENDLLYYRLINGLELININIPILNVFFTDGWRQYICIEYIYIA